MKIHVLRLFLLAFIIIAGQNTFAQQFAGKVIDEETSEPVPFASVYLVDIQLGTKTDTLGQFVIKGDLPEVLNVKISAFGYETVISAFETTKPVIIKLKENHLEIDEIVVSTPGSNQQRSNVTHVELRSLEEINAVPGTNLGEVISRIPGVYNASTGTGVSKPVIRGMQGIRVVTMLNGLRIENQQWGGDHGMGITELGIGNIEVIKGPASLLYGADALGGVIYYSDESYVDQNNFSAKLSSQFETASLGLTNQATFRFAKGKQRFNLGVRSSDHGDYRVSDNLFVHNSRYYDRGIKAAYGVSSKNWVMHLRYNYYNSRVGIIGEHEHEEEMGEEHEEHEFLEEEPGRYGILPAQNYDNHYLSLENKIFKRSNEYYFLVGQTMNHLREHEVSFDTAAMNAQLNNSYYNIRWTHKFSDKTKLINGVQGMFQFNRNHTTAEEELIPNANQLDNGIYSILQRNSDKWSFQGGVRYDFRILQNLTAESGGDYFFNGVNFSAGGVYTGKSAVSRLNVSSGIRMPHLSEMFAEGEHHGAMRYEIGDDGLAPEKGFQIDLTQEFQGDHISLILNPFYNIFQNYIYLHPEDTMISNLPVYKYDQLSFANLGGVDLSVHYHPHFAHGLHIESNCSYIYAEGENHKPLPLIPQGRLRTQLKYVLNMKSTFKVKEVILQHSYYMAQRRNSDLETPTVDYHLIDLGINMAVDTKSPLTIGVGVKNLLDQHYVNHLSRLKSMGISGPGRNIYLKLTYELNGKM